MLQELKENELLQKLFSWVGLFGSFGTLFFCAILSTLFLLGFGATLAQFTGNFSDMILLSENKGYVFGFSFLILGFSFIGQKLTQHKVCLIDNRDDCEITESWPEPIF